MRLDLSALSDEQIDSFVNGDERTAPAPAAPWEPPIPFNERDLPQFPAEIFSGWLRDFVKAEAEATQTPLDLAGMLALAVCAAAVAKKVVITPRSGWIEPLNLFTITALPPASRKSAVFADISEQLIEYEEELTSQITPEIEEAKTRRKILEGSLNQAQSEASKAKGLKREELTREAAELSRQLAQSDIPSLPRLVVDDCSPERLAGLLQEQDGKIAILAAEGDTFDIMGGRYNSGSPNLGVYLRGHAGDTLRVDRVGRPAEYVKNPALTLGLAVQPDVLRGLIHKPGFRGRGLLGRFLYALPRPNIGHRKTSPAPVPGPVKAAFKRNIRAMLSVPFGTDQAGKPAAHVLRLNNEAQELFNGFETWLEPQLAEFGELGTIQDWSGKLAGAILRIIGILRMAEQVENPAPWAEPIGVKTVSAALMFSQYLIPHAKAAFDEMGANPDIDAARYILDWINKKGLEAFSKRDLFQGIKGRFKQVKDLEPGLKLLTDHGFIREKAMPDEDPSRPGRKPSTIYEVNPHPHNSHNPQNTSPVVNSEDTENIENGKEDLEGEF